MTEGNPIAYPFNFNYVPGSWKGLLTPKGRSATFTCPNGHTCALDHHEIAADGAVTPSVVCPYEGCGFHEFIKLEGWQDKKWYIE